MLVWLSLAVAVVAFGASLAFAVVRWLELWRQLKSTGRTLAEALDRVSAAADATATRADALGGATERLDAALRHLAQSRARLRVLQEAWSDVSASFGRVSGYVPREKRA